LTLPVWLRRLLVGAFTFVCVMPVCGQSIDAFQARYLASIATPEGQAYEAVAEAELWRDLEFLPKCIDRVGVASGAITVYYEVDTSGKVTELFMVPDTDLAECIRRHVLQRRSTPPPDTWVGRVVLTISR
jgi:hypothetical protein